MKGNIFVLLAAAGISFVSCSQSGDDYADTKIIRSDSPAYSDEFVTVGFVQTGKESDWRDANTSDFLNTFTEENGYYLIYIDGNSSSERQKKAVSDLISQDIDFVIVDPIVEDGWDDVLERAKLRKTEVIIADRMVNSDEDNYLCWVGSDFYIEGIKCGEWLEGYLKESGRYNEKIDIVLIEGTEGASATIGRTAGLMKVIERNPLWNLAAGRCGEFEKGAGKLAMDSVIDDAENIDVVIAENDSMILGAMNSMESAGIRYGTDGGVITASFDAMHEAFEKMADGELFVSVECNPLLAGKVRSIIEDRIAGKSIEKKYYIEEDVFTYKNAAENIASRKY